MKKKPVKRPDRTVIIKSKSGEYVYLTKGVHYSSELKRTSPIRVAIGKLDENGMLIPNNNYFDIFGVDDEVIDASDRSDVMITGPQFVVGKIAENVGIDALLTTIFGEKTSKILDVVTYMIMSENNVMQYFGDYGYNHSLFNGDNFSDSTICELFKELKENDIDTFIKAWVNLRSSEEIYVSYDSTNMNSVAGNIDLVEYGHAKDNEELPQVNVSLGYDQTNGSPLFYELYPGSIIDNTECSKMVERAKMYGVKNIGLILDRGYFSVQNIKFFERNGFDYLIMTKSNANFIKESFNKYGAKLKNGYTHYLSDYELYGMTIEDELFDTGKKQYIHLYFNGIESEKEKIIINNRFKELDKKLEELREKKIKKEEELNSYKKNYKLSFDENGYFINYQRKENTIKKLLNNTGYFALISSKEMDAAEALRTYRDRDAVEKVFRMEKSYLGNDVFRVHSNEKLESKVFISFVALIIRNEIYKAMKPLYLKNRKEYTVPKVLRDLERLYLTRLSDGKYHVRYNLTKKQKSIIKALNINQEDYNEFIKNVKSALD